MGKTNIYCSLSEKSLDKAIKAVRAYRERIEDKNDLFVRRLAELGIPIIDENISASRGDSDKNHHTYIKLTSLRGYSEARLVVEGKDLLFIEFGAGVHYNTSAGSSPNPKGAELGYTIGSYGKGLGTNDYWYYIDDTGVKHRSYGTEATMPVYKASVEIIQNIRKIAKEVFGG